MEQVSIYEKIDRMCALTLEHSSECNEANCDRRSCGDMKRVVRHARNCPKTAKDNCHVCVDLENISTVHFKKCDKEDCNVIFCGDTGKKKDEQTEENRQAMMRQMVIWDARMKAPRTPENRQMLFNELKRTPHLFSAYLTMSRSQEAGNTNEPNITAYQGTSIVESDVKPLTQEQLAFRELLMTMLAELEIRLKESKTSAESEQVFTELKRNPPLFATGLRMSRNMEAHSPPLFPLLMQWFAHQDAFRNTPVQSVKPSIEASLGMSSSHTDQNLMKELAILEARVKETKTPDERQTLFNELKRTPHLFSAFLKMSRHEEKLFPEAVAMFSACFAPGPF